MSDHTPQPYFPQDIDNYAPWVATHGLLYPYGECQCGCHQRTRVTPKTSKRFGYLKNHPCRYIKGHAPVWNDPAQKEGPNPSGICMCGCGEKTPLATRTNGKNGNVVGKPLRFMPSHSQRLPDSSERECTKCKRVFPLTTDHFHKANNMSNGFASACKTCVNKAAVANGKHKAYYVANREAAKEKSRRYHAANKERISKRAKAYNKANRHRFSKQQRKTRSKKKEQIAQYNREWRKANKGYMKAHKHRRRALKQGSEGHHTAADVNRLYEQQGGKCCYCGCNLNGVYHVDHVIPLTRGGSDDVNNIAIACPFCNQSKGNKLLSEWSSPLAK